MTEGPFGFDRLTDAGLFTTDEVEVDVITKEQTPTVVPPEFDKVASEKGWSTDNHKRFEMRIEIKPKYEDTNLSILDEMRREVAELGKRAARADYLVFENGKAYAARIDVTYKLRRRGVATRLKKATHEHMREMGVDEVYSYPATDKGEKLLRKLGYIDSGVAGTMVKSL